MTIFDDIFWWQLRMWIWDNLCYLTINCDTGQHSQFLRCFTEISLVWVKYEFIFSFSSFTSSFFLSASSSSLTLLFSSSLSSCSFVIILICSFWTKSHWSWLNLGLFFVLVISSCQWLTSATSHKKIHLASKIYPKTYIFGKLNCTKYGCMAKSSLFWIWFNVFGRLEDANQLRTIAKYVAGRVIRTSLGSFSGLDNQFYCMIWHLWDTNQPVLYIIQCFCDICGSQSVW